MLAKTFVQRATDLLRRHDPLILYASLLLTGFPALARIARERARETIMRSSLVRSLNGLASSSGGTSAIGSATTSALAAAGAARRGLSAGASAGAAVSAGRTAATAPSVLLATGTPALARMARERARDTSMRSSLVRSLKGLLSSSAGTSISAGAASTAAGCTAAAAGVAALLGAACRGAALAAAAAAFAASC